MIEEDRFIELLSRRLSLSIPTSEDAVRYTFFAALAEAGMEPEKLILEYQHPDIEAAKVDAVILGDAGQPKVAIEFKYDRRNRGGTPQPLPQKAGAAFADLARLARLPQDLERLFVHVMDDELSKYLQSSRNGLHPVYNLKAGESVKIMPEFFDGRSHTFNGRLGIWPPNVVVRLVSVRSLPERHIVYFFAID